MNRKKLILTLLMMSVFLVLTSFSVLSFGPNLHLNILDFAINESENTLIKKIVMENIDACYAGLVYADAGVFYYYTNFKLYKGLHNYNTVDEMLRLAKNDRDRAFAYCFKIHLASDAVSHNIFVPSYIRSTKIPNYIIHPIVELRVEGNYLDIRATRLLDKHKEFDELVTKAVGRDWSKEVDSLRVIIGGGQFYDKAFTPDSTTWIGRSQRAAHKLIAVFVSDKSVVDYRRLSIEESKAVLRGETGSLDPSGEEALAQADKESRLLTYFFSLLIIGAAYFISWKKRWI